MIRAQLSGRELRALAVASAFYSVPRELDSERGYSVAASEMLLPHGRPVGTEVEAVAAYLDR